MGINAVRTSYDVRGIDVCSSSVIRKYAFVEMFSLDTLRWIFFRVSNENFIGKCVDWRSLI
jgi:hypothetical protein